MRSTRFVAAILLAAYLSACTSYQVMANPASGLQAPPKPIKEARVTLRNGTVLELNSPKVDGDSVRGTLDGGAPKSVALADMASLEVKRTDAVGTVIFGLGVVVLAGAVVVGIFLLTFDWSS